MGVDYIKNLKVEKDNNRIICDIADGNVTPLRYYHCELYDYISDFEKKYAYLIRSIISRNASIFRH